MNEQSNNTNAAFMEVTSRKVEVYDKKIEVLEQKLMSIPDNKDLIQKLTDMVEVLGNDINNNRFPPEKMAAFSKQLDTNIKLLRQPIINKVVRHHYIPKLIWITA